MKKILFIQASPRTERSHSLAAAREFIKFYRQKNPSDQITELDIFKADLPAFDGLTVQAKYAVLHGKEHTQQQRKAWDQVEAVIDNFKSYDKYIIALGMWNFGIPYRLKQYLDIIVQPGLTFTVTDQGYQGLLKGKPVLCVYARGGSYSDPESSKADFQIPYMQTILGFMGFEDIRSIVVEPTLADGPQAAENAAKNAARKAEAIAQDF